MTVTHTRCDTHTHTHTPSSSLYLFSHTHSRLLLSISSHLEHVAIFLNRVLLLLRRLTGRLLRLLLLPRRVEVERVHRHGSETGRKETGERTRGKGRGGKDEGGTGR